MKIYQNIVVAVAALVLVVFVSSKFSSADPQEEIKADTRCSVCGMFVAKYPSWITQVLHDDGTVYFFDGIKDMLAYYLAPQKYGNQQKDSIKEIWVKDYYSLNWLHAQEAYYVSGSDVYGPMGHELIPFHSRKAAESFLKDHKGKQVFAFDEIPAEIVEGLRSGHTMK